jgi:HlyD family secretion protein
VLSPDEVTVPRAVQTALFTARQELEQGRRDRLAERIAQFQNQTEGVNGLINAKRQQLALVEAELMTLASLSKKGLVRAPQVMAAQREQADLLGQLAELGSDIARIQNSIRDTELEVLQGQRQRREEVMDALRKATTSIFELRQQIESTEKQLSRVTIRAPNTGRIHELQVTTIGGVVAPGATLLQIIPLDQGVSFRTRVAPVSVDQLFVGQPATLRFPAFDRRETPEVKGVVQDISPTSVVDAATGQSFFWATLAASPEELARLGDLQLVPGMPVEAYLKTGERTVLSYLTKPMSDQMAHAFREN